jgi:hypothetical protein
VFDPRILTTPTAVPAVLLLRRGACPWLKLLQTPEQLHGLSPEECKQLLLSSATLRTTDGNTPLHSPGTPSPMVAQQCPVSNDDEDATASPLQPAASAGVDEGTSKALATARAALEWYEKSVAARRMQTLGVLGTYSRKLGAALLLFASADSATARCLTCRHHSASDTSCRAFAEAADAAANAKRRCSWSHARGRSVTPAISNCRPTRTSPAAVEHCEQCQGGPVQPVRCVRSVDVSSGRSTRR